MSRSPSRPAVQVVYTPGSGAGRAGRIARRIARGLERRGATARVQGFRDLPALAAWSAACGSTFSHLVCVGGDATLSAAAPAAMRHGVPFLPVPTGFGNLFAGAFALPDHARGALGVFDVGLARGVDVGVAGDGVFLSHCSYGWLSDIQQAVEHSARPPRRRWLRLLAYYRMARRFLVDAPLPSIRVEVDGRLVAEGAPIVTVANVETYRGYLSLTPDASPIDGRLDVFLMEAAPRPRVWARLAGLLLGGPRAVAGLVRCQARRVRVCVDGRPPDELRVLPGALTLLMPAAAHRRAPAPALASAPPRWRPAPERSRPAAGLDAAR
jgi:diacylglycerol kinase family enzyme